MKFSSATGRPPLTSRRSREAKALKLVPGSVRGSAGVQLWPGAEDQTVASRRPSSVRIGLILDRLSGQEIEANGNFRRYLCVNAPAFDEKRSDQE
jgi:hypothetical protein